MDAPVLMVGVICGDRLLSVSRLRPGDVVSLTARPGDEMPAEPGAPSRYELLRYTADGATLFLRRGMTGRLGTTKDGVHGTEDIGELVARLVPAGADLAEMQLGPDDRGRVVVGDLSVLWRPDSSSDLQGVEVWMPAGFSFG